MNRKATDIVSYISLVGWLIAYFAGDREGAKFHLNQALVLNVASIALGVIGFLLGLILGWVPLVGSLVALLVWVANVALFVFWIMGLVAAIQEQERPLPLLGGIQLLH